MAEKREASSPLQDDSKRSCFDDNSLSEASDFLSSTVIDSDAGRSVKEQVKLALSDPEVLELLSKAIAAQVSHQLRNEITSLKKALEQKDRDISRLQDKVDELEQYGRRTSIRISNIPELPGEDTDSIAKKIGHEIGVPLDDVTIERSHRVGRREVGSGRPASRPILVKLSSYRQKHALMGAKKKLAEVDLSKTFPNLPWALPPNRRQGSTPRVYLNEDLTKVRAEVAAAARQSKREGKISDTWTRDGIIFLKKDDRISKITTKRELEISVA